MRIRLVIGSLVALVAVAPSRGETPLGTAFTYQGQLKQSGAPFEGTADFEFTLWDDAGSGDPPTGGTQVGGVQVINALQVTAGLFTVTLNAGGAFGGNAFNGNARWLQIAVRSPAGGGLFTTLAPRQPLTATPHTLFALNADRLDGLDSSVFLQSVPVPLTLSGTSDTHIIRGENSHANGKAIAGYSTATGLGFPQPMGVYGESTATNGRGVVGSAPGFGVIGSGGQVGVSGSGFTGVSGSSTAEGGRAVFGSAFGPGQNYGGYFEAMPPIGEDPVGTGVYGSGYNGVVGFATNPDGNGVSGTADGPNGWGVNGESLEGFGVRGTSSSGTGVFGVANASTGTTYGVYGESYSGTSGASGVFGLATDTSGVTNGVYGQSDSQEGNGVHGLTTASIGNGFGVLGESLSASGRGIVGVAWGGGETYGVLGRTTSSGTNAAGVRGLASAQSGTTYGVWGQSESTAGYGVIGISTPTGGTTYGVYGRSASTAGRGVYGLASAASGLTYGVLGQATTNGWAVFSNGDMGASGLKPFRIDHPDDPASKYLLHYSAESPEVINFYSETVTLDEHGEAVVELPHYFAKINTRPRYQLTAVGAPMPMLHVAEEIDEAALSAGATAGPGVAAPACTFRIAGGAPGAKVSWEVKALRNDLWVRNRAVPMEVIANGMSIQTRAMPVEVEKQGVEKGTYQHPELYGLSAEMGMNYDAERERDLHDRPDTERPASHTSPDATPH